MAEPIEKPDCSDEEFEELKRDIRATRERYWALQDRYRDLTGRRYQPF